MIQDFSGRDSRRQLLRVSRIPHGSCYEAKLQLRNKTGGKREPLGCECFEIGLFSSSVRGRHLQSRDYLHSVQTTDILHVTKIIMKLPVHTALYHDRLALPKPE